MSQAAILAMMGARRRAPAADPNFANVVLLMHMDDAGLTDVKGKTITKRGSVVQSAGGTGKFGTAAEYPSTGTPGISVPLGVDGNYGSGDFTVEAWIKITNLVSGRAILSQIVLGQLASAGASFYFGVDGAEKLVVNAVVGSTVGSLVSASAVPTGVFAHVSVVRSGDVYSLSINGIKDANTLTQAGALNAWSAMESGYSVGACVGCQTNGITYNFANMDGLIDEVRITKGVARYTADFTPPAFPFPNA